LQYDSKFNKVNIEYYESVISDPEGNQIEITI